MSNAKMYTEQLEEALREARMEIRRLRSQLQKKETQITRLMAQIQEEANPELLSDYKFRKVMAKQIKDADAEMIGNMKTIHDLYEKHYR